MNQTSKETYWLPSYETLYETSYYEYTAEALTARWEWIHIMTSIFVSITASGSAVAGWALWSDPAWRIGWVIFAGGASIASIIHTTIGVPGRVRETEKIRSFFSQLRVDLKTFRQRLDMDLNPTDADTQYGELRGRYAHGVSLQRYDIANTSRLRSRAQNQVNESLKEYITDE